jgi:DNA replication protein DnaC
MHATPQCRQLEERMNSLNGVINQLAPGVSHCFIVISGDLAFSGSHEQYLFLSSHLHSLKQETESKELFNTIQYLMVPGNHDVDPHLDNEERKNLIKKIQGNTGTQLDQSLIKAVTKAQSAFFDFSQEICPKPQSMQHGLYYQFIFNCGPYPIVFNCFNTAWMSTIPEDQGKLRFPIDAITMKTETGNPISFSVLHHPFIWFKSEDAKSLRRFLFNNSNFILTGHEHDSDTYKVIDAKGRISDYLEGGLFNREGCDQSSFNTIILDLETRTSHVIQFTWSSGDYRKSSTTPWNSVQNRYSDLSFVPNEEYMKKIDSLDYDFHHPRKDPLKLSDIYVNPDLEKASTKDKTSYSNERVENIGQLLQEEEHLLIIGPHQLGKTALLRRLFCDLVSDGQLVPIIVDGRALKTVNAVQVSELLERTIENTYSKELVDKYSKLSRTQKVLMIDDFDKSPLNFHGRDLVLKQLENIFTYIVLTSTSLVYIDELTAERHTALSRYARVTISEFGYYLRRLLIEKWLHIGEQYDVEETEIQSRLKFLEHEINSVMGNHVLPYNPFIILTLLQAADFNYDISTAAGAYGYYYEILIKHTIAKTSVSTRETGIKMGFLSCLAYYMFIHQKQHVDSPDMSKFCANVYFPFSKLTIDSNRIIAELVSSGILGFDGGRYYFAHPYEYQYFTALFMSDNLRSSDETLSKQIKYTIVRLCNNLHRENYSNIVMFLSYLSKEPLVLDILTANADKLFTDVTPCDLTKDVEFINKFEPESLLISFAEVPHEKSRETVLRSQDRIEREDNQLLFPQDEVGEATELQLIPSIIYSFSLINILGQILKNYLGVLDSGHKQKIVDVCCSLGLRILKKILVNIEQSLPELRKDYGKSLQEEGRQFLESELNIRFVGYIYEISVLLSMLVVRSLTFAVGAPELEIIYVGTQQKLDILPIGLLNLSIRLEYYKDPPTAEVIDINKTVKKNAVAKELLEQLVILNMYLYDWPFKKRQQVLSEFGLQKLQSDPRFLLPGRKLLSKAERKKQSPNS